MTVVHFNAYTGRWHVEETSTTGEVWSTDFETANALAAGYRANGFKSHVITAAQLAHRVENLPHHGSLVAELGMFEY
jgi:hypothetical protein